MFENIGWGEILVLIVAGLFILGPERLPGAAQWLGKSVRQVRDFATGARDQLKGELGPEYDELRKPLEDLRSLRGMNPRTAITKHLLDGYDPVEDVKQFDVRSDFDVNAPAEKRNGYPRATTPAAQQHPLAPGERAPFDPDAT
jgi:sec-independent protein translocase protein TatB